MPTSVFERNISLLFFQKRWCAEVTSRPEDLYCLFIWVGCPTGFRKFSGLTRQCQVAPPSVVNSACPRVRTTRLGSLSETSKPSAPAFCCNQNAPSAPVHAVLIFRSWGRDEKKAHRRTRFRPGKVINARSGGQPRVVFNEETRPAVLGNEQAVVGADVNILAVPKHAAEPDFVVCWGENGSPRPPIPKKYNLFHRGKGRSGGVANAVNRG